VSFKVEDSILIVLHNICWLTSGGDEVVVNEYEHYKDNLTVVITNIVLDVCALVFGDIFRRIGNNWKHKINPF